MFECTNQCILIGARMVLSLSRSIYLSAQQYNKVVSNNHMCTVCVHSLDFPNGKNKSAKRYDDTRELSFNAYAEDNFDLKHDQELIVWERLDLRLVG